MFEVRPNILLSLLATAVTVVGFAIVARTLVVRARTQGGEPALFAFAWWWAGMSARAAAEGASTAAAALGLSDLAFHVTLLHFGYVSLAAALWGLTSYLVAVYSGSMRHARFLAAFYGALLVAIITTIALRVPVAVTLGTHTATILFEHDFPTLRRILLGVVFIPILTGALFYASLYRRTDDPRPRYRIALVSAAALAWGAAGGAVRAFGLDGTDWWPLLIRALALVGTALVLLAFHPPVSVRARWAAWEIRAGV